MIKNKLRFIVLIELILVFKKFAAKIVKILIVYILIVNIFTIWIKKKSEVTSDFFEGDLEPFGIQFGVCFHVLGDVVKGHVPP